MLDKLKEMFKSRKPVEEDGLKIPMPPVLEVKSQAGMMTIALITALEELEISLEDYIAGLIVVQMGMDQLQWPDYWILVAKYASRIPLLLGQFEEGDEF